MGVLTRMSGEELLLRRIVHGKSVAAMVDAELDRRTLRGPVRQTGGTVPASQRMHRRVVSLAVAA